MSKLFSQAPTCTLPQLEHETFTGEARTPFPSFVFLVSGILVFTFASAQWRGETLDRDSTLRPGALGRHRIINVWIILSDTSGGIGKIRGSNFQSQLQAYLRLESA